MEKSNYRYIINNYEGGDVIEKLNTQQTNKGLVQHIKSMGDDMRKYHVKPILITLIHNPFYMLKGQAWMSIKEDRNNILEKLKEDKTIVYALSSIEVHPGKGGRIGKDDRQKLNESIKDSKRNVKRLHMKNSNTYKNNKAKTKVKKTLAKSTAMLIEKSKLILSMLTKETEKGKINSSIIKGLSEFSTSKTRKDWSKRTCRDKLRLIISLYEATSTDNALYEYMMTLYAKTNIDGKLDDKYMKVIDLYDFLNDDILTLQGYPHIHIAIGLVSKDGEYTLCSEIYTKLIKLCLFDDIKVDERKNTKKGYLNSINYVLKNDRYAGIKSIIKEPIVKGYIGIDDPNILDKMKGIGSKELKNGQVRKRVEMELLYVCDRLEGMASDIPFNRLVSYIIYKMKKHGYVICEGVVYAKREGSKMSYDRYMDLDEFYTNITNKPEYLMVSNKYKSGILDRMRTRYRKIKGIDDDEDNSGPNLLFPKIEMDTMNVWIECKDFFYNTLTGSIVRDNARYYSYYYCNWLELKDIEKYLQGHRKNGIWTNILSNSNLDINKTCIELYRLLVLPQVPKGGVWYGYGESNSGKSSLVKPFLNIYPPDQIGSIRGTIGRFDLYSVKDKAIIQGEEINPHTLNIEDGLKLLGREPLTVEKKHGSSDRGIIRGRQIYTSNDLEDELNEGFSGTLKKYYGAFNNRITKMKFDTLKDVLIDASSDINGETALTILMCGYYYFDKKLNNGNKGYIGEILKTYEDVDEIESTIQKELDKYNGYYKVSSDKPESVKRYENMAGIITPPRSMGLRSEKSNYDRYTPLDNGDDAPLDIY